MDAAPTPGPAADSVLAFDETYRVRLGAWDFLLGMSGLAVMGRALIMADIGCWWYGDLPDLELRDGMTWGVSMGGIMRSSRLSLLATLQGSERPEAGSSGPSHGFTSRDLYRCLAALDGSYYDCNNIDRSAS